MFAGEPGQSGQSSSSGQWASAKGGGKGPAVYGQQGLAGHRPGEGVMEFISNPVHGGPPGYAFRIGDLKEHELHKVAH